MKGKSIYLTAKQIRMINAALSEMEDEYNDDTEEEKIICEIIDKLNN
jgi:hypothetical protein|tara:strand:+ start:706 stop:846 length:141 start_codon:yes stop_codon:yes gene_type:complete